MKRNRTPSVSGTSTGDNNNTSVSVVNKKQKVLFTPCRRVGLTRKGATNSSLNASQTNATAKNTTKRKLDDKLSVFDFKDSPRNSPQNSTLKSKEGDDVTSSNVVDTEICPIISEPTDRETPKIKSKRGISQKATAPVQLSTDQDTSLKQHLSPKVLLCKLDLNKIKISSPYTISDSEESEMLKSPKKVNDHHKKSIKEKIEFSTKISEDAESNISQISETEANIQCNKLSKRKNKPILNSQTNLLTSKSLESDKISDAKISPVSAKETENSHNNRVSPNVVDDFASRRKTRKNKISSSLKNKKTIPSESQEDKIDSSQLISLHENVKTTEIESDTIKNEIVKSRNVISDDESDSNEPLIKLRYPRRAHLKPTKSTTVPQEKHDAPVGLKSKTLRSYAIRKTLPETKESDTNLQDSTNSKHKKSTKIVSSETLEIDQSTKVTTELDNSEREKHDTRPTIKSKGSRKLFIDSPQFSEKECESPEPEKFGWEKHESTPKSEKRKQFCETITTIPTLETQKPESKNPSCENIPTKSKKDISQSPDSDKETKLDCGTSKHKKSTKNADEGQDSIWEKYKTEAKRRQEKDASNTKHKNLVKPVQNTGWEKHETPTNIKPKKITKLAFPSEDWNKELQELDMHMQTKINANLKRKTTKLSSELPDTNIATEIKEPDSDFQPKKDFANLKHKKTKTVPESLNSIKVSETIKPKACTEIAFPKVQENTNKVSEIINPKASTEIVSPKVQENTNKVSETIKSKTSTEIGVPKVQEDTNKVSETIKPKTSTEIGVPKVQEDTNKVSETIKPKASTKIGVPKVQEDINKVSETRKPKSSTEIAPPKVVKNMLSVVNLANLKDIEYIKRVSESEGLVLDQQKSSASVESYEYVKKTELPPTNQNLKGIESKLQVGTRESIKELQNVHTDTIGIQSSSGVVPDINLKSSKDLKTKELNKLIPQHSPKEIQVLDMQPNASRNSDLSPRPNELLHSGIISYKHKKSTTLFPSTDSQNSIKDLLELDVNLQVLKSQSNRILSDDESITSELNFVHKKEPPKLKSCLSKKSKFTTAIQEMKETDSYQQQRSRSLKSNSQSQHSEYSQMSPDVSDNESQHTEKRKNKRSTSAKHKKHISKPSTSNKIENPDKSSQSVDYSDSEDDFREKQVLGRRRKSSLSIKSDDRVKGKKLIKPVVDELNKTEHIRIRENISYTIIHKGNVISYVKSHDNDVDMKTTESDDNQQAPVLIKMCTKSTESRKSMIIERRNYTSTNTSLSVSDKENSDNADTENETALTGNIILEAKKEYKKHESEKKRKTSNENKLLEEKKTIHETDHNRNKPALSTELLKPNVMENKPESVVDNESNINKNIENEKTTLRNELLEARITNETQEIVAENSNCDNEKEKSIIRTELKDKLTALEPVTELIQTSTNAGNKEIEQEKFSTRNESLGTKKTQKNLNSDNIEQENVTIRNELLEVRKKCKKLEHVTERVQIEQDKLHTRNELVEARKKDKRRISEKIRKHKANQHIKDPSITKTTQTVKTASTSSAIDNSTTETMMTVEQIKKEIKGTEARLKVKQEHLDRLNRLQVYKKAHDLKELRKVTLQIKSGCREALIDLLLVLKEHSNAQFDMGTLLHNMKISNDLVGYNEEEDCFV